MRGERDLGAGDSESGGMAMRATEVLIPGTAEAPVLRLVQPVSLWGGVDPATGIILDVRHPQCGESVAGRILAMERIVGSSSGSSILLELMAIGKGPAAILLTESDAIAVLGVVVAREMGYGSIPVLRIEPDVLISLPSSLRIEEDGSMLAVRCSF